MPFPVNRANTTSRSRPSTPLFFVGKFETTACEVKKINWHTGVFQVSCPEVLWKVSGTTLYCKEVKTTTSTITTTTTTTQAATTTQQATDTTTNATTTQAATTPTNAETTIGTTATAKATTTPTTRSILVNSSATTVVAATTAKHATVCVFIRKTYNDTGAQVLCTVNITFENYDYGAVNLTSSEPDSFDTLLRKALTEVGVADAAKTIITYSEGSIVAALSFSNPKEAKLVNRNANKIKKSVNASFVPPPAKQTQGPPQNTTSSVASTAPVPLASTASTTPSVAAADSDGGGTGGVVVAVVVVLLMVLAAVVVAYGRVKKRNQPSASPSYVWSVDANTEQLDDTAKTCGKYTSRWYNISLD